MAQPLALCVFDKIRMIRGGANGAAVFGGDAVGLLDAGADDARDTAPYQCPRLLIKRLHFVAFLDVDDGDFFINIDTIRNIWLTCVIYFAQATGLVRVRSCHPASRG